MANVDDIVRGLTKAQRWALVAAEPIMNVWYPTCRSRAVENALITRGLVDQSFGRITKYGLEVRARLLSSSGEGK